MRLLTDHKLNGLNDAIAITVLDEPSSVGGNHEYKLDLIVDAGVKSSTVVSFQNGPVSGGFNGFSNEALLAIVIDRLRGVQGENPRPVETNADQFPHTQWGKFRCRENALALTHLQEALHWLHHRTRERQARGVEGTLQK